MNEEQMRARIDELEKQAAGHRSEAVRTELRKQLPDAPAALETFAGHELSGTDGDVSAVVSHFLTTEDAKELLGIQKTQAKQKSNKETTQPGKAKNLKGMLSEIASGKAQIRIT